MRCQRPPRKDGDNSPFPPEFKCGHDWITVVKGELRDVPLAHKFWAFGYHTRDAVAQLRDGEILMLPQCGPTALSRIRQRIPYAPSLEDDALIGWCSA